jgi:hypothetical protein
VVFSVGGDSGRRHVAAWYFEWASKLENSNEKVTVDGKLSGRSDLRWGHDPAVSQGLVHCKKKRR